MKILLYALAFIVELVAWTACGASVFLVTGGLLAWVLAVLVFAVVVALWGAVMAPRARWPLPTPWYYLAKVVLYGFAAVALWLFAPWAGFAFSAAVLVSEPLLYRYRGDDVAGAGAPVSRAGGPDA